MAIAFHRVTAPPLASFDSAAPDGVVIGILGEDGAGKGRLLRIAAGIEKAPDGSVDRSGAAKLLGPDDALDLEPAPLVLIHHTFARHDAFARERGAIGLDRLRRARATTLLVSHDEDLLRRVADEVWWIHEGRLAGRGDPGEVLASYRRHVSARIRAWGETASQTPAPRMRRGDGRAEVLGIETLGENGCPTMVWRSGEPVTIKVRVRFHQDVADPVIGIMIRTRIGLNVYGTNTELEKLTLGPRAAGDTIDVAFAFRCDLCPEEYTLTVASHDPDGVWHDWLEDAISFAVSDTRYTAGVANLRANVTFDVG